MTSLHDSLVDLAERDYWVLKNTVFKEYTAGVKEWHSAGYRRGYRDALRHSSQVGEVLPLFRRFTDALEEKP